MIRRAFTLVELLITVAIIAVLIGLLLPAIGLVRNTTKTTATGQRLSQIGNACEAYRLLFRRYPDEQGVTWAWNAGSKTSTPAWIASSSFPEAHREAVSTTTSGPATLVGLADLLETHADLQIPGEALAKTGPVAGMSHLVDGWGAPLRYQRFSEGANGVLGKRATWWLDPTRTPPVAVSGTAGEREGFALYSPGSAGPRIEGRNPAAPADDSDSAPGVWWSDPVKLVYRSAGQ